MATTRLCLTLAIALALVGTFSHNVHAVAAEAAPVPPTADVVDDTFNYEQYQSPPIWTRMFFSFSSVLSLWDAFSTVSPSPQNCTILLFSAHLCFVN